MSASVWTTEPRYTSAINCYQSCCEHRTANSITLTWTAATDNVAVTGYDVYVDVTLKATSWSTTIMV
jgi:hypothetical protein